MTEGNDVVPTQNTGSFAVKDVVFESAAPIVRFIGHSLAASLGLVLLTVVLLIPIGLVKILVMFGFTELGATIKNLETGLLYAELAFFLVIFSIGAFELIVVEGVRTFGRIRRAHRAAKV